MIRIYRYRLAGVRPSAGLLEAIKKRAEIMTNGHKGVDKVQIDRDGNDVILTIDVKGVDQWRIRNAALQIITALLIATGINLSSATLESVSRHPYNMNGKRAKRQKAETSTSC